MVTCAEMVRLVCLIGQVSLVSKIVKFVKLYHWWNLVTCAQNSPSSFLVRPGQSILSLTYISLIYGILSNFPATIRAKSGTWAKMISFLYVIFAPN